MRKLRDLGIDSRVTLYYLYMIRVIMSSTLVHCRPFKSVVLFANLIVIVRFIALSKLVVFVSECCRVSEILPSF